MNLPGGASETINLSYFVVNNHTKGSNCMVNFERLSAQQTDAYPSQTLFIHRVFTIFVHSLLKYDQLQLPII